MVLFENKREQHSLLETIFGTEKSDFCLNTYKPKDFVAELEI
jgi:hypothetical protein